LIILLAHISWPPGPDARGYNKHYGPAPHLSYPSLFPAKPHKAAPTHNLLAVAQAAQTGITAGFSLLSVDLCNDCHSHYWTKTHIRISGVLISLNCNLSTCILHHVEAARQDSKYLKRAGEESLHQFYLTPQEKRVAPSKYQQWHSRPLPRSHQKCHPSRQPSTSQDFPKHPSKTK